MDLQVLMNLYIIIMGVWHPSVHVVAILGSGFYWICSEGFFSDNHSDCSHILAQSQNIICHYLIPSTCCWLAARRRRRAAQDGGDLGRRGTAPHFQRHRI